MGYRDLLDILEESSNEIKENNNKILKDYVCGLKELTNRRQFMKQQKCLEDSELIIKNWGKLNIHINNAKQDTKELIVWMKSEIEDNFKKTLV